MPSTRARRVSWGLPLAATLLVSPPLAAKAPASATAQTPPERAEATRQALSAERGACFDHHELGQVLRQAGKLMDSRAEFLSCTVNACPTAVQRDCERWSNEVAAALPRIAFQVRFQGKLRNDASIEIDGEPHSDALSSSAILDPGRHRYRVQLSGARSAEGQLTLRAGEPAHQLTLELESSEPERRVPTLSWVLGGAGAAGLTSFIGFGLASRSLELELERSCSPACDERQIDRVRERSRIANVSLGVGLASLAGAAAVYLLSTPGEAAPEPPRVELSLVPLGEGALGNVRLRAF